MPASYEHILFVGDVLHVRNIYFRYFFDTIDEPIRQATGLVPRRFLEVEGERSPATTRFLAELGDVDLENLGTRCFFSLPRTARDIFVEQVPANSLVIAFEPVPWIGAICDELGVDWVDMRVSPLRYGSDLFMAMRSSSAALNEKIDRWALSEDRLRLEAGRLRAKLRVHQEQVKLQGVLVQDLSDACVYLGQTPTDAALFADDGHIVRCEEYPDRIRAAAGDRKALYKGHPYAPAGFADREMKALETMLGRPLSLCFANAYQLLSCHPGVSLVGLSSGLMQEAAYFGVDATVLFRYFCKLSERASREASVQLDYQDFISPELWSHLLGGGSYKGRPSDTVRVPNACREGSGAWWDYGRVMTWNNNLLIEGFERSGGKVLRDRIMQLEAVLLPPSAEGETATARAETGALLFLRDKLGIASMLGLGATAEGMAEVAASLGIAGTALPRPPAAGACGDLDLAWAADFLEHLTQEQALRCLAALEPCRYLVCTLPEATRAWWLEQLLRHGFACDEFLTQTIRTRSGAAGGRLGRNGMFFRRHASGPQPGSQGPDRGAA